MGEPHEDGVEDDFYKLLNVAPDATADEIRASFKRLARVYHPDLHSTAAPEKQKQAASHFRAMKNAYKVLSDPTQRMLYDLYGAEALRRCWDVSMHQKTREEVRREFERLAQRMHARQQGAGGGGGLDLKGSMVASVSLANVADQWQSTGTVRSGGDPGRGLEPVVTSMRMTQQLRVPVDARTEITLGTALSTMPGAAVLTQQEQWIRYQQQEALRRGDPDAAHSAMQLINTRLLGGTGQLSASVRRTLSPSSYGWTAVTVTRHITNLQFGGFYRLSKRSNCQVVCNANERGGSLTLLAQRQLTQRVTGMVSVTEGQQQSMNVLLQRQGEQTLISAGLKMSPHDIALRCKHERQLTANMRSELSVSVDAALDISFDIGGRRSLGPDSEAGFKVSVMPGGVLMQVSYQRQQQHYAFPLFLTNEPTAAAVGAAVLVPVLATLAVRRWVLEPRARARARRQRAEVRRQHRAEVERDREAAAEKVELMRSTVVRKRAAEEARRGLVVVEALYGRLDELEKKIEKVDGEGELEPAVVDVTVPVQYIVEDSLLVMRPGCKASILGFYDPCPDEDKTLRIRYRFKNRLHEVTVRDEEPISLPRKAHLLKKSSSASQSAAKSGTSNKR